MALQIDAAAPLSLCLVTKVCLNLFVLGPWDYHFYHTTGLTRGIFTKEAASEVGQAWRHFGLVHQ